VGTRSPKQFSGGCCSARGPNPDVCEDRRVLRYPDKLQHIVLMRHAKIERCTWLDRICIVSFMRPSSAHPIPHHFISCHLISAAIFLFFCAYCLSQRRIIAFDSEEDRPSRDAKVSHFSDTCLRAQCLRIVMRSPLGRSGRETRITFGQLSDFCTHSHRTTFESIVHGLIGPAT
jgi:hypothetical protein